VIGCICDPLILYYGGYRYNQPNHLYHVILIVHAVAYFAYDSIIEIVYGTADTLTNFHHLFVLLGTYFHLMNNYSGWEYIVLHFMAEISNPFLIIRTVLKLMKMKNTSYYFINDIIFAVVFIIMRAFCTPVVMIMFYEAENCIYSTKICVGLVLFIQMFWV